MEKIVSLLTRKLNKLRDIKFLAHNPQHTNHSTNKTFSINSAKPHHTHIHTSTYIYHQPYEYSNIYVFVF